MKRRGRIRELEEQGYRYSGIYERDNEVAKDRAKEERAKGNKATVVFKPSSRYSRGPGGGGYSVYVKESEANKRANKLKTFDGRIRNLEWRKNNLLKELNEVDLKLKEEKWDKETFILENK